MAANAVRPQLHVLACNMANLHCTLALPTEMQTWSVTKLRKKLVKIAAKVMTQAHHTVFHVAEVAVPRHLFRRVLELISDLRPPQIARC